MPMPGGIPKPIGIIPGFAPPIIGGIPGPMPPIPAIIMAGGIIPGMFGPPIIGLVPIAARPAPMMPGPGLGPVRSAANRAEAFAMPLAAIIPFGPGPIRSAVGIGPGPPIGPRKAAACINIWGPQGPGPVICHGAIPYIIGGVPIRPIIGPGGNGMPPGR